MKPIQTPLCIFSINFPLGKGETFLYPEVLYLAKHFKTIYIFPLEDLENESQYELPGNIIVIRHQLFQPFNRISITLSNIRLISNIYLIELSHSKNRFKYISLFFSTLNNLTHKISAADKLQAEFKLLGINNYIAYSYWFNQWAFVLSIMNKKIRQYPVYSRIHGMDVYEEQHTNPDFFFQFRSFQLKQIEKVLAVSENGRKHFIHANRCDHSQVIVSRLGVNDSGLNPVNQGTVFRLASCSAFQAYKRVHLIIEILKNSTANIEWVHFGDGELKKEILQQSQQLPANISFNWMGYCKNEQVMNYYKTNPVDLFINVSETEGIPVSIMEAISFGIPVIATNVGGVNEIVNESTGFLIEKDFNPVSVARIIDEYIALPREEKSEKRQSSRDFWSENYSAYKNYNELSVILSEKCVG